MSWSIRLKLKMLPILDSNGIDAQIINKDISARLGLPRDLVEKVKTKEAVKVFYSAASAEGYIEEMMGGIVGMRQYGFAWKRIGHLLVFFRIPPLAVRAAGIPPTPFKGIVRTAESIWKLYDFRKAES